MDMFLTIAGFTLLSIVIIGGILLYVLLFISIRELIKLNRKGD